MAHAPFFRRDRRPTIGQLASGALTAYSTYKDASDAYELASSAYQYLTGSGTQTQNPSTRQKNIGTRKMSGSRPKTLKIYSGKDAKGNPCYKLTKAGRIRETNKRRKQYSYKEEIKSELKDIKSDINSILSTHTFKKSYTSYVRPTFNAVGYKDFGPTDLTQLQEALSHLRMFNPSTGGDYTAVDLKTSGTSKQIKIESMYSKLKVMNNYQVPADVRVYLCKAKGDVGVDPSTSFANGITDQVISGTSASLDLYPTEITEFSKNWNTTLMKKVVLQPGSSFVVSHTTDGFNFNPALYDTNTSKYQARFKSFTFLVRVSGVISHEPTGATIGISPAGVDLESTRIYKISYNANGASYKDIYISDIRDTATASAVVSSKPVSDNVAYSQG